jgi:hypothetical protein
LPAGRPEERRSLRLSGSFGSGLRGAGATVSCQVRPPGGGSGSTYSLDRSGSFGETQPAAPLGAKRRQHSTWRDFLGELCMTLDLRFDEAVNGCGRRECGGLGQLILADGLVAGGAGRNRQLEKIAWLVDWTSAPGVVYPSVTLIRYQPL